MGDKTHWENIYTSKPETDVSWYRPRMDTSLSLIELLRLPASANIVDVGGGASTLVDDLLAAGYQQITVLDLSSVALEKAKARLGERAARIRWLQADITTAKFPAATYDLWHDRAVFHFLTDTSERVAYVRLATDAIRPSGYLVIATFAADGPERCSALTVARYSAEELAGQFPGFAVVESRRDLHETPFHKVQPFTYLLMRRM